VESCADHSLSGASNAISTPSNPCMPSSLLSIDRNVSSRSASIVLSGTRTVVAIDPHLTTFRRPRHVLGGQNRASRGQTKGQVYVPFMSLLAPLRQRRLDS